MNYLHITCGNCGAYFCTYGIDIDSNAGYLRCPFCDFKEIDYIDGSRLKDIAYTFNLAFEIADIIVEAVFVENNGISNPSLIVMFSGTFISKGNDEEFWRENFGLDDRLTVVERADKSFQSPSEIIYFFDKYAIDTPEGFQKELDKAINIFLKFADKAYYRYNQKLD